MKVSNMLFNLSAPTEGSDEQTTSPAFLPSSGASSIYLDSIAPNGTADISIELNAKSRSSSEAIQHGTFHEI